MKNVSIPITMILIMIFVLSSCSNKAIQADEDGSMKEYAIGSVFKIQLEGLPDQGFMWKTVGLNRSIIEQIGEVEIKTAAETGKEFGTYTFTFKTKAAGSALLRLMYFNKEVEDPEPKDDFEIKIVSGTMGRIEA